MQPGSCAVPCVEGLYVNGDGVFQVTEDLCAEGPSMPFSAVPGLIVRRRIDGAWFDVPAMLVYAFDLGCRVICTTARYIVSWNGKNALLWEFHDSIVLPVDGLMPNGIIVGMNRGVFLTPYGKPLCTYRGKLRWRLRAGNIIILEDGAERLQISPGGLVIPL